jgi:methylglutaconyl-CoA hydratase
MAIHATKWHSAQWAAQKGMYAEVFETTEAMDKAILEFAQRLAQSSPEAMAALKKVFWEGTDHWDQLLTERAAISGRLVMSNYTKNAISGFKAGQRS